MLRATLFFVVFAAAVPCMGAEDKTAVEETAYFYIGGLNGPAFHVNIRGGRLLYRAGSGFNQADITWTERPLEKGEFALLAAELKKIGVGKWQPRYVDPKIEDGTQWQVTVKSKDLNCDVHGSNSYPKGFGALKTYISKTLLKGARFE